MRMHVLQHVPFEGAAGIGEWARKRGHVLTRTRLFAGETLPDPGSVDWLVVMGGPMGVHDTDRHSWLRQEMEYVGRAMAEGKGVLGVCLGAQIMACALGAEVERNREKEIGWFPVRLSEAGRACEMFRDFPDSVTVLHWHGETFAIPEGALRAMSSEGCVNQAFVADGGRTVGLQFHLELGRDDLARLVENCREDMTAGPFVQDAQDMLAASAFASTRQLLFSFLDRMAAVVDRYRGIG